MAKKQVTARNGQEFEVDISAEAIAEFVVDGGRKLKHGDRIISNGSGKEGVVMGVARMSVWNNSGQKVLWIMLDGDEGKVCFVFKGGVMPLK